MSVFYTSDIHFGNERIMKLCDRPFDTADEMDNIIVAKWNVKVKPTDKVFVLGDLVEEKDFRPELLNRLNGRISLVIGNHDYPIHGEICDETKVNWEGDLFYREEKRIYLAELPIVMFHYPIMEWNGMEKGSVLLYGHVHNKRIPEVDGYFRDKLAFNVSMDVNDFEPQTILELVKRENKEEIFMNRYGNLVKGGLID